MKLGKVPRAEQTKANNLIYPDKQKYYFIKKRFNPSLHNKNIKELKKIQEENKLKKVERENYTPTEPFKIKEFKNALPKINTLNTTKLHPKPEKKLKKNNSSTQLVSYGNPQNEENILDLINNNSKSNNNQDYVIMGKKDYVISTINYENEDKNYTEKKEKNTEKKLGPIRNKSMGKLQTSEINEKKQDKHKEKLKGKTPKATEINTLLPKKTVDHISENRNLDTVPIRAKIEKKEEEPFDHKNYGKTPDQ